MFIRNCKTPDTQTLINEREKKKNIPIHWKKTKNCAKNNQKKLTYRIGLYGFGKIETTTTKKNVVFFITIHFPIKRFVFCRFQMILFFEWSTSEMQIECDWCPESIGNFGKLFFFLDKKKLNCCTSCSGWPSADVFPNQSYQPTLQFMHFQRFACPIHIYTMLLFSISRTPSRAFPIFFILFYFPFNFQLPTSTTLLLHWKIMLYDKWDVKHGDTRSPEYLVHNSSSHKHKHTQQRINKQKKGFN